MLRAWGEWQDFDVYSIWGKGNRHWFWVLDDGHLLSCVSLLLDRAVSFKLVLLWVSFIFMVSFTTCFEGSWSGVLSLCPAKHLPSEYLLDSLVMPCGLLKPRLRTSALGSAGALCLPLPGGCCAGVMRHPASTQSTLCNQHTVNPLFDRPVQPTPGSCVRTFVLLKDVSSNRVLK